MAGFIPIFGTIIVMAGCQTPGVSTFGGDEGVVLTADNAEHLVADLIPMVHAAFNPATTTFALAPEMEKKTVGKKLEDALRKDGYAVSIDPNVPGAVKIGYEVDHFGDEVLRISLIAGESFQVSRLYDENDDGSLDPESPFTAWQDGQASTVPHRRQKLLSKLLEPPPKPAPKPIVAVMALPPKPEIPAPAPAPKPVVAVAPATPPAPAVASDDESSADNGPDDPDVPNENDSHTFIARPNNENLVVIAPSMFAAADSQVPDPFVQIYQPKILAHSLPLQINGIQLGDEPCVVINNKRYAKHDKIEGFEIRAITRDTVWLQRYAVNVKLPMSKAPYLIKYP